MEQLNVIMLQSFLAACLARPVRRETVACLADQRASRDGTG